MRTIAYLLALWLGAVTALAQSIEGGLVGLNNGLDSVKKEVLSSVKIRVLYSYDRRVTPKDTFNIAHSSMILSVGGGYTSFRDAYLFASDTLQDNAYKRGVKSFSEISGAWQRLRRQARSKEEIFVNYKSDSLRVTYPIVVNNYEYIEPLPKLEWQLEDADSVVLGYSCRLATITFRGRSYRAWYAPEISLPYGPWKLSGLPGLILCSYDLDGDHKYTAQGIEEVKEYVSLYQPIIDGRVMRVSRKESFKIDYNYAHDPASFWRNLKGIYMDEKDLSEMKPLPYNPQELE